MPAPVDPFTGALLQGASSFGKGLGESLGGGGPFTGGASQAGAYGNSLGNAGWVVNLGGNQVASASPTNTQADPMSLARPVAAGFGGNTVVWVLGAAFAYLLIKRLRK